MRIWMRLKTIGTGDLSESKRTLTSGMCLNAIPDAPELPPATPTTTTIPIPRTTATPTETVIGTITDGVAAT